MYSTTVLTVFTALKKLTRLLSLFWCKFWHLTFFLNSRQQRVWYNYNMRTGHIYALADPKTGEVRYIGKTLLQPAEKRLKGHVKTMEIGSRRHVYNWMRKLNALPQFIIIEAVSESKINELERYWIRWMRLTGVRLTNLTDGGDGGAHSTSAETRAKMSVARRGRPIPIEQRAKMSDTARNRSPEYRAKIAAANRRRIISDRERANRSAASRGRVTSSQARANMSKAQSGKILSKDHRQKISESLCGKTFSVEHRANISAVNKGKIIPEKQRTKISASLKGRVFSEEHRKKLSEARQRQIARDKLDKELFASMYRVAFTLEDQSS